MNPDLPSSDNPKTDEQNLTRNTRTSNTPVDTHTLYDGYTQVSDLAQHESETSHVQDARTLYDASSQFTNSELKTIENDMTRDIDYDWDDDPTLISINSIRIPFLFESNTNRVDMTACSLI